MRTFTEAEVEEMQYCEKCGYVQSQCECEKPKTNFDRIKAMSVEEMARFLNGIDHYFDDEQCIVVLDGNPMNDYQDDIIEWLQQEVEE